MFSKDENSTNKNEQRESLLTSKCALFRGVNVDPWKQVLFFAVGNVFTLSLIVFIVAAMMTSMYKLDRENASLLVGYSIAFILLMLVLGFDIKKYFPKFAHWMPYVVGVGLGLLMMGIDEGYIRFVNLFYDTGLGGNEADIRKIIAQYPVASVFILGLIGPMCEELTYRVGTFGLLKRWHRVPAYIISALIFGFIHMKYDGNIATEFIILPTYIGSGALLAFAYDLFDLPCSYTAHITNNLFVIIYQIVVLKS